MIDSNRLRDEVKRQYAAATASWSNRRRTVPDFRPEHGGRLVKWGLILDAAAFPDGDEEAVAENVVDRIVDFERGLMDGEGGTVPSSVVRCFLKGHEIPDVFPVERAQIKVRHVFGVHSIGHGAGG